MDSPTFAKYGVARGQARGQGTHGPGKIDRAETAGQRRPVLRRKDAVDPEV